MNGSRGAHSEGEGLSRRALLRAGVRAGVGVLALSASLTAAPLRVAAQTSRRLQRDRRAHAEERIVEQLRELAAATSRFEPASAPAGEVPLPFGRKEARKRLLASLPVSRLERLAANPDALRAFLENRKRADYAVSRLDYVDGWLLSETELCVLALGAKSRDEAAGLHSGRVFG